MIDVLLLVAGLALLTIAADRFVLGCARLSAALRVSPVVIGVVVIGFGTSAPEMVVTVLAAAQGSVDLAFGNVVGSNTANVLLVLGAAALVCPIAVRVSTLRREVPLMVAGAVALALAVAGGTTVLAGLALIGLGAAAIGWLVWLAVRDRAGVATLTAGLAEYEQAAATGTGRAVGLAVGGLVGTVAGAQMLVTGASGVARLLGVPEAIIGLTIVAIGTSLPELVTAVAAARRREGDLIAGNVLGSNLFNSLPIAGLAALFGTATLDPAFGRALAVMVGACLLAALFLLTGRRLARTEGAMMLALFLAAMTSNSV